MSGRVGGRPGGGAGGGGGMPGGARGFMAGGGLLVTLAVGGIAINQSLFNGEYSSVSLHALFLGFGVVPLSYPSLGRREARSSWTRLRQRSRIWNVSPDINLFRQR